MIRIAVVGYGGMGEYHAWHLLKGNDFDISGVYDIAPSRIEAAKKAGLRMYASKEEIAGDAGTDAVLIATPNDFHREYAEYFAGNKKHIVCEKPAAITAADFDRMTAAAEKTGVVLAVHQNRRQDKDYLTVREIAESGLIGRVYRVDSRVNGANGIPGGWRKTLKQGGGMMLDWGVHLIDQMVTLPWCGLNPGSIYCRYDFEQGFEVEDGFWFSAGYGGVCYNIEVQTNCYAETPRWMLFGTMGTAVLHGFDGKGKIVVRTDSGEEAKAEKLGNGYSKTMAASPDSCRQEVPVPEVAADGGLFYREFKNAVQGVSAHGVKSAEVRRVLEIMELAKKSARLGEVIKL